MSAGKTVAAMIVSAGLAAVAAGSAAYAVGHKMGEQAQLKKTISTLETVANEQSQPGNFFGGMRDAACSQYAREKIYSAARKLAEEYQK